MTGEGEAPGLQPAITKQPCPEIHSPMERTLFTRKKTLEKGNLWRKHDGINAGVSLGSSVVFRGLTLVLGFAFAKRLFPCLI